MAQAPPVPEGSSTWWYPLGNPEGTRRNPAPTLTGSPDELTIKWRTTALKNSPVVLVGGLRLLGGKTQQIVGIEAGTNRLKILSEKGKIQLDTLYDGAFDERPYTLRLTGLFNSNSPTPTGIGRPNLIGLGVEREQKKGPPDPDSLRGILTGPDGRILHTIPMSRIPNGEEPESYLAGVYPTAVFKPSQDEPPMILAHASQFNYRGPAGVPNPRNQNGIWRFKLEGTGSDAIDPLWFYPIAPGTYPQQPAIIVDTTRDTSTYVGVSTRSLGLPGGIAVPATAGHITYSTSQYSISLDASDPLAPRPVETRRMPPQVVQELRGDSTGETNSYFFRLKSNNPSPVPGTNDIYRVVTSNYSQNRPGTPVILVAYAAAALSEEAIKQIGLEYNANLPPSLRNKGWTIVAADVDGSDFGTYDKATRDDFPLNESDEVIAAYRDMNGADIKGNSLLVYRLNYDAKAPDGRPFWAPVTVSFDGRLLAAADLVKDPKGKQELVIANGNTLSILRLRDYDVVAAEPVIDISKRRWFDSLRKFTFDSTVVSVAIADLEGTGDNDLIVVTKTATYAIGRPIAEPLGTVEEEGGTYCLGDDVTVDWGRRIVGGGEEGLSIHALDSDSNEIPLIDPFPLPDTATAYGELSYRFSTLGLEPGSYEVVIRDKVLPDLKARGGRFTIATPLLQAVKLPKNEYAWGEPITFRVGYLCTKNLVLERRSGSGGEWREQEEAIVDYPAGTDSVVVSTSISCLDPCMTENLETVEFRLRDTTLRIESGSDSFIIRSTAKHVDSGQGSGTTREIGWNRTDFGCESVSISLTLEGKGIEGGGIFPNVGTATLRLGNEVSGKVEARICCIGNATACDFGKTSFEVEAPPAGNYIQPNPFDPNGAGGMGVSIYYTLEEEGPVSITIIDAARAVVRRLLSSEDRRKGLNVDEWDGRNSAGEIVANGTYICIIESGDGRITPLPIFVRKL